MTTASEVSGSTKEGTETLTCSLAPLTSVQEGPLLALRGASRAVQFAEVTRCDAEQIQRRTWGGSDGQMSRNSRAFVYFRVTPVGSGIPTGRGHVLHVCASRDNVFTWIFVDKR